MARPHGHGHVATAQPRRLHVLLIERRDGPVRSLREHLQDFPGPAFRFLLADQLESACALLDRESVDLALLDLDPWEPAGRKIFDTLRMRWPEMPVIVIADGLTAEDQTQLIVDGAYDAVNRQEQPARTLARGLWYAIARHEAELHTRSIGTLISADPDALVVSDEHDTVRFANEAASRLFNQPVEELLGQRLGFSVAEGTTAEIDIADGTGHRTGEMRTVRITWSGRPASLAVIRDVTERKEVLRQFHEAQKLDALGRLAGGVAHDFNNLLAIMLASAELLGDEVADQEPACGLLAQIRRAGERAAAITGQLLTFCRKSPVQPQSVDLNAVTDGCLQMLSRIIGPGIRLQSDLDDALCPIYIDPVRADQIIINLVINARDALPHGGTITVRTRCSGPGPDATETAGGEPPGRHAILTVEDDGVGMAEDVKSKVFEPFFTTKVDGQGSGLGLAAVSGIVAQAGGRITVESSLGAGATFTVLLPLAATPTPAEAPTREVQPGQERILLVDDEDDLRDLVAMLLRGAGYDVTGAGNGDDAVALAAQGPFDLLLADVIMPGMNGFEVAAAVRTRQPAVKVLFMTGFPEAHEGEIGLEPGYATIAKPFTRNQLLGAIDKAINRQAERRTTRSRYREEIGPGRIDQAASRS